YTTLLAICIWTIWIVDFSVPGPIDRLGKVKGTDFLHFYVTGSLVHEGRWEQLYDARAQFERASTVAPGSPDTVFIPIESPQTAAHRRPRARHARLQASLGRRRRSGPSFRGRVARGRGHRVRRRGTARADVACRRFSGDDGVRTGSSIAPADRRHARAAARRL